VSRDCWSSSFALAAACWQSAGANNAGRRSTVVHVGERHSSDADQARVLEVVLSASSPLSAAVGCQQADRDYDHRSLDEAIISAHGRGVMAPDLTQAA
jgi:hypothetical protein